MVFASFTTDLAIARSSRSAKSSDVRTAVAIGLGLSNGNTSTAHLIRTGSGCVAITPPPGERACLKGTYPAGPRRPAQGPTAD